MNSYQISLICVLVVTMSSAHIGGRTQDQELVKVYCGRTLSNALDMLCTDMNLREANLVKRSDVGMYDGILSLPEKEDMRMTWPWVVPYKARGLSAPRRKRQQIVNECCDKACSIDELLTYCG